MSRTRKDSKGGGAYGAGRRIAVRGVRRDPIDIRKLSRALIELAQAQAEADARAEGTQAHPRAARGLPGGARPQVGIDDKDGSA